MFSFDLLLTKPLLNLSLSRTTRKIHIVKDLSLVTEGDNRKQYIKEIRMKKKKAKYGNVFCIVYEC